MAPPSKKRKTNSTAPAEIKFDFSAREEYLTGFHKRKQARIKHAQEQAAKQEKEERLRLRKQLRDQRKEDLEKHVNEVNALLKKANGDLNEGGETTENGDEDEDAFEGFDETEPEVVDREEEYIDEDKYTTVTIESVGISREGFEKAVEDKDKEEDGDKENNTGKEGGNDDGGDGDGKKRVWTKERPKTDRPKKKKKQKFRYETKAERKMTRAKEGAKKRKQAEARKSK